MYRSASWNRVSDDYSSIQSPPSLMRTASSFEDSDQQLPLYDLQITADMAKKERARLKFAENAVHLIPLVLILCALILWFFSTTPGIIIPFNYRRQKKYKFIKTITSFIYFSFSC